MNQLLQRQLQKYFNGADKLPKNFNALFNIISQTYDHYEKDRKMIERSIDLSSKEMVDLNNELKKEKEGLLKAHNELKHNEFVLKQAQAITNIGSWSIDLLSNKATWSEEMCLIFGFTSGENQQTFESFLSFVHPKDLDYVKKEIEKSHATLTNVSFYTRIVRKDETIRHIYMDSRFEFNLEGKPISKYGIVHDITKIKEEEEKKQFSKRNLRALINNTNDLMWSVDRNFKLITSNKAFDEMIVYMSGRPIERQGNLLETGFSPEEIERFKSYYERAFAGEKFKVENHSDTPVEYWSETSFYPIYKDDIIIGTACFSRNITERKLVEIKLSQFTHELIEIKTKLEYEGARFKQAQQIAHIGNWELDFASGIALWSDEACRIYGLSLEENKQSYDSWLSFIHPDDLHFVLKKIREGQASQQSTSFYHRILRKDGIIRFIYSQSQLEFNAAGKPIGIYGVAQDVTEQKIAEQQILRKNDELRDLSNHVQNIREEERASISREIHDELGQQLTALKMDIGWIMRKQTNPDESVVLKLKQMLQFSDRLIVTIRRISSDLRPAIIDDLGLVAALEWICDDFEAKTEIPCRFISNIKERKFEDRFSITTYRILQESLTNIRRHAEAKSVTVSASEHNKELFLEIADDGKGICDEGIRKGKTLGVIGMKERAALLGGELIITGTINKGTNVKLMLPIKNEHTHS